MNVCLGLKTYHTLFTTTEVVNLSSTTSYLSNWMKISRVIGREWRMGDVRILKIQFFFRGDPRYCTFMSETFRRQT